MLLFVAFSHKLVFDYELSHSRVIYSISQNIYFIGFFFALGFGSAGIVALIRPAR